MALVLNPIIAEGRDVAAAGCLLAVGSRLYQLLNG